MTSTTNESCSSVSLNVSSTIRAANGSIVFEGNALRRDLPQRSGDGRDRLRIERLILVFDRHDLERGIAE